jgi:predicted protein tyrosine phosphatase
VKRVLFVCSQNRLRSPTAEQVFSVRSDLECNSAGLNHDAENPVTSELVEWAEIIFVMEKTHRNKLRQKFKSHLGKARVICLDIPDEYEYMDPELVRLLKNKAGRFLPTAYAGT